VLDVAERLMLRDGYDATTVAAVAEGADVSPETVYKSFGAKPDLVRALVRRGLEGAGPEPAETRSDRLRATDPTSLVEGWSRLAQEVAPQVAPLLLLARAASVADPRLRQEYDELEAVRLDRMRDNATALSALGGLREGITVDEAGDVLFAVSSPEMYEVLVLRQRWSAERYGRFVRDTLTYALLP